MKFIFSLIKDSITLDFRTLKIKEWSFSKKFTFILTKYKLLIKHFFKKFKLGEDFVYFEGKKIFYDSKYGLAGYQRINCSHRKLIKDVANIENVQVILDVGANVGFFSMLCRELYPDSKIYAFEPVPKTFTCLKKNFKDDRSIVVNNVAILDSVGKAKMDFEDQNPAGASIKVDGAVEVSVNTLDSYCDNNKIKYIDILKIDVETSETFVLQGAQKILSITKYIYIEILIENNRNFTISQLFKLLYSEKFNFQILGIRNFTDSGEGSVWGMDVILKNINITH